MVGSRFQKPRQALFQTRIIPRTAIALDRVDRRIDMRAALFRMRARFEHQESADGSHDHPAAIFWRTGPERLPATRRVSAYALDEKQNVGPFCDEGAAHQRVAR